MAIEIIFDAAEAVLSVSGTKQGFILGAIVAVLSVSGTMRGVIFDVTGVLSVPEMTGGVGFVSVVEVLFDSGTA
jgi:uncharacterized membrane protein